MKLSFENARLAAEQLHELADCHTRRITMRVHNNVRTYAALRERHILLVDDQTRDSLLAVATAELVAYFRPARLPHQQLDQEGVVVVA